MFPILRTYTEFKSTDWKSLSKILLILRKSKIRFEMCETGSQGFIEWRKFKKIKNVNCTADFYWQK